MSLITWQLQQIWGLTETTKGRVRADRDTMPTSITLGSPESRPRGMQRQLRYHVFDLLLGFLSICLAGYILSQAATNIMNEFGISDALFGVIILVITITLPSSLWWVANVDTQAFWLQIAFGSNILLLDLCVGIIMLRTRGTLNEGNVNIAELLVLCGSTLFLMLTVRFGARLGR